MSPPTSIYTTIHQPTTQQVKLKVLIVDDNLLNLRVMKQLLKTKLADFLDLDSLQTADSGFEALDLLRNNDFHLLFLDISMPGISGLEVCRRLRNDSRYSSSKLHICAVTTDLADWQVQLYKSIGMDGVIGKPLKNLDLEFALRACLDSVLYQNHLETLLPPAFYFRRYGSQQLLPDILLSPIDAPSDPVVSLHSLSTITSTAPLLTSSIGLQPILSCDDQRKFRQQSVVSDISVAGVLAYEEPSTFRRIPRPCLGQLDLVDETLISACRPCFDSFDTSSASGSIITCSSSGPNSATAIDPLSPSYCSEDEPFEHSKRFPAFPTAPIITSTHVPLGLRSPRRWSSPLYSVGSPLADAQLTQEEKDVFAAGFQAAMNNMAIDQACSQWGENCLSATTPSANESRYGNLEPARSSTTQNMSNWADEDDEADEERLEEQEEEEDEQDSYRWARLAGPISCEDTKLSSVTRQLISRRSHPMLRLNNLDRTRTSEAEPRPVELRPTPEPDSPFMRKSKSAAGLPIRPSWQLVQLSAINYQSVLKSGTLLDEVLFGLDLEDSP
ncbi:sensitivity to red-light reduced protein, variant 2 [Puccinia graminis f. sp. tritici]|uniref:Response regulatory domain-containing protein n=3 Tax=Puccinia graminis f. sp. tritici TaxID=56615 RepID=E3L225_PUCGT|nr:uncharacterized protein PGTG_16626 [Puccinia graminis f. sp. tritici CRL 75-36-700-3]EFP90600.1 hypothetical protein PGTG_16626 [Puccinia graminis f. sp. tritici CRL 75-36-700-3]KAA1108222.1 sensitivity to red-light reduced protein, variant 2 [Puccinia graminis f. sp. tritici]KAA1130061.1 sensitivity to red-light reduced protein [Puccinia graminis f. sp. tritici]